MKNAAVFAAFFVVGAVGVEAQDKLATLSSPTGAFSLSGEIIGYDGRYLRLMTDHGEVSVDFVGLDCLGPGCPDPAAFVPHLRISGATGLVDGLIQPLVAAYGRENGWVLEMDGASFTLVNASTGSAAMIVSAQPRSSAESFADLIAFEADLALTDRPANEAEASLANSIGLGDLTKPDLARIIALDAVVPIVSPVRDERDVSLTVLENVLQGDVRDWAGLGGGNGSISLVRPDGPFLPLPGGQSGVGGTVPLGDVGRRVAASADALGVTGFGRWGNARPLAITGPCGRPIAATRESLKTSDYPLTRPVFLIRPERRLPDGAQDFLVWLRSREAQGVIRRSGLVDLSAGRIPIASQGERLAGAIAAAGPEVGLGELQRLVRILSNHDRLTPTFRFQDGATRLSPQSRSYLLQLARGILDGVYNGDELMLVGFSDGRGPALVNRDLSRARAEAVRRELLRTLGGEMPDAVTVTTEAFGEVLPIACDEVVWGQNLNRRVELWIRRRAP